jgi:hypothetical protein
MFTPVMIKLFKKLNGTDLSGTMDAVVEAGQLFNANGAAGVHLSSCNSNFCSHPKFATVSKLG